MTKRRMMSGKLALILAVLAAPTALTVQEITAQEAKPKSAGRRTVRTQRVDPMTQTQGSRDQAEEDQVLVYRFRLDTDSAGSRLMVSNSSDGEGAIALFAQEADGAITSEIKRTVEPGGVLAISAEEAGWSSSNVVSVKASRRLVLSLQLPGADKPAEIARDAGVAIYEVFGFERQSDLAPSGKRRGLSLLYSGRRFTRELSPETSLQQGASELLETSGASPTRGLFVLQGN
jgi:hypothetical protein